MVTLDWFVAPATLLAVVCSLAISWMLLVSSSSATGSANVKIEMVLGSVSPLSQVTPMPLKPA